jgi:hypothetical protein
MPYSSYALHLADAFSDPDRGEQFRKEIFRALGERLEGLRALRKKLTAAGVPVETETEVDRMIQSYQGPDGLLVLFMDETDADATTGKTGKDDRQLDWTKARAVPGDPPEVIVDIAADGSIISDPSGVLEGRDDVDVPASAGEIAKALHYIRLHPHIRQMDPAYVREALSKCSQRDVLTITGYFLALQSAAPGVTVRAPKPVEDLIATIVDWQDAAHTLAEIPGGGRAEPDLVADDFPD